jgi:hypothetical protein
MKPFAIVVTLLALACLAGGCTDQVTNPDPSRYFVFSFEGSMEGWSKSALDIDNPPVTWEISLTLDMARDSTSSVRFYVNNINDKSKIYIERGFDADAGVDYKVRVSYQLASRDWGQANLWTIITGATTLPAASPTDLETQGSTGNGYGSDVGPMWMYRSYEFNDVRASDAGKIYVQIGIWGTSEFARTYYLDSVYVILTRE